MPQQHPEIVPDDNEDWLPIGSRYPSLLSVENNAMNGEFVYADPFVEVMARAADIFARYAYGELAEDSLQTLSFRNDEQDSIWTLTRRVVGDISSGQVSLNLLISDIQDTERMPLVADVAYFLDDSAELTIPSVSSNGLLAPDSSRHVQANQFTAYLDKIDDELSLK